MPDESTSTDSTCDAGAVATPKPPSGPWWRGERGEWLVAFQFVLFALIAFAPARLSGWPAWPQPLATIATWLGLGLMVAGAALALGGVFRLGPNLTALPYPKDCSELVQTGAYGIVRHPIYSGLILGSFGIGLWRHGGLTLLYALALFVFFDFKSRLEERWLAEKFAEYPAYRERVKKLVPGLY